MGSWKYSSLPWKRRCLQNGTFEEKLSFRQNSLSLGFSYGKAAEKQSWESITEERVHHTLPRRGSSVKGLAKDEKNGGHKKKRASVEALPGKRVLLCKVGCCFANCSRRKRVPSNSPWKRVLANERWLHAKGTSSLELSLKRVLRKRKMIDFLIKWWPEGRNWEFRAWIDDDWLVQRLNLEG